MYQYTICNNAARDVYKAQCAALEKNIPQLVPMEELEDVDGSLSMRYLYDGKSIIVRNSHFLDAVYIDSEIPLAPFFADD